MSLSEQEIRKWMQEAVRLAAEAASRDEVPIGAVLVHEGKVLATGSNVREATRRTSGHAEMEALETYNRQARAWRLPPGTSLFVTLEPCVMCTGALLWARLENVYFGCADPRGAGLNAIQPLIEAGRFDHRFQTVRGQVLKADCAALMTDFFRKKRGRAASTEPFTIRPAGEPDALAIHEAHMRSIRENCAKDYSPEQIRAWGERPFDEARRLDAIRHDTVWVVECAGRIEGYGHLRRCAPDSDTAEIWGLYVTKCVLGRGAGKALLDRLESAARAAGIKRIRLESTLTSREFYLSRGYRVTGPRTDSPIRGVPIPAWPMEKLL